MASEPENRTLSQLIQAKGMEMEPILYPGLTHSQVETLWNNFGNANPILRQNYLVYFNGLMDANPAVTNENAMFIINSGVTWLINAAQNIRDSPFYISSTGGKRLSKKKKN